MGNLLDLFVFKYNRTDFHELNLDWLISDVRTLGETLKNFININTIKYADPIQWNITRQYEANTVVIDPATGTAYLSTQPVPSGVAISNDEYWTTIFTLDLLSSNPNITLRNDENNVLATFASVAGDWLIWNNTLYKVSRDIALNEAYVPGYNLTRFTVELFIKEYISTLSETIGDLVNLTTEDKSSVVAAINDVLETLSDLVGSLDDLNTTDKSNVVAAINEVLETLSDLVGSLDDLNTTDKSNVVAAINEIVNNTTTLSKLQIVTPQMFGALADGVHDDTAAINAALVASKMVYFPDGIYRTTSPINIPIGSHLFGNIYNAAAGNTYGATILHDGDGNTLNIQNYAPCIIENLMIDKINSTDGHGIHAVLVDNFIINNVRVINHGVGIYIDGTSFGTIRGCVCERNYFDGFYFTNNGTLSTCQVQVLDCLSELNNGNGYHFVSTQSTMPVGKFDGNKTFANTTGGIVFESTSANNKITGVYISNCFIGSDGYLGGIYLDKMGYPANIVNCYFEESGMSPTGREYNTPASHIGYGIYVPINNSQGVTITGCTFATSAYSGVSLSSRAMISNCSFMNNGLAPNASATQKCGLLVVNTECVVSNCDFVSGVDGIYVYSSSPIKIIGNRFGTTNPIQNAQPATQIRFNIGVADAN